MNLNGLVPGYFDRCNRAPDCPPGCDCAAYERYLESDEYEHDQWFEAVIRSGETLPA